MRARLDGDTIVIEAAGTELLRTKAALSSAIGPSNVKIRSGGGLAIPSGLVSGAFEILTKLNPDLLLAEKIASFQRHSAARNVALSIIANGFSGELEGGWNQRLDTHQVVAAAAMAVPGLCGLCLFDEQGAGKTVMTIAAFDILRLRDQVDRMIVLCPKTMIDVWRKDFEQFLPGKYKIASLTDPADPVHLPGFEKFDVYLTNYEGLARVGGRLAATSKLTRTLLIVDESFFLKNPDARRTAMANTLRASCTLGFVLCGTPAPNSFVDVISQFDLADGGFTFGNVRPDNATEVQRRIDERGVMIRRLKREILPELVDKRILPVRVDLSPRQRALYDRARDTIELRLRTLDNKTIVRPTDSYFQERAALLQICSIPAAVDPAFDETATKLLELDALLESLVEGQGKKVVLWSFYRESIAQFITRYARFNPVVITGDTPAVDRVRAVAAFQNDPGVKLFIGNARAAGAGITLTAASDAIYYSLSNNAADFLQSLDRIHRRGQMAPEVNIYVLMGTNTIEEHDFERLLGKEKAQHDLLKDPDPEKFTVADALAELGPSNVG